MISGLLLLFSESRFSTVLLLDALFFDVQQLLVLSTF